tara:strand:- start:4185 stop:5174 length:990 start_codon:yes stop_codon:yes gene_type:complete
MSSSDYTNLRRIRHVYYPTLTTCAQPTTMTISCAQGQLAVSNDCGCNQVSHTHSGCNQVSHTHSGCGGNTVADHSHTNCGCNENTLAQTEHLIPDRTTTVTTPTEYFVKPKLFGTATFAIDKCLSFSKGSYVSVVQDVSNSNYFEAEIFDYANDTGLLQLYNISVVAGPFSVASKLTISLFPGYKEVKLVRDRMAVLYKSVFNIDISPTDTAFGGLVPSLPTLPTVPTTPTTGTLTTEELTAALAKIVTRYSYFFGTNITTDSTYEQTEEYLETKINELYIYFFNANVSSSTDASLNPNNNGVALSTVLVKIEQFDLYFFGSTTPNVSA